MLERQSVTDGRIDGDWHPILTGVGAGDFDVDDPYILEGFQVLLSDITGLLELVLSRPGVIVFGIPVEERGDGKVLHDHVGIDITGGNDGKVT